MRHTLYVIKQQSSDITILLNKDFLLDKKIKTKQTNKINPWNILYLVTMMSEIIHSS